MTTYNAYIPDLVGAIREIALGEALRAEVIREHAVARSIEARFLASGEEVLRVATHCHPEIVSITYSDVYVINKDSITELHPTVRNLRWVAGRFRMLQPDHASVILGQLFAAILNHQTAFRRLIENPSTDKYINEQLRLITIKIDGVAYQWYAENTPHAPGYWIPESTMLVATALFPIIMEWVNRSGVSGAAEFQCDRCRN
ncbi:hypothetical protein NPX13_g4649 [Xylaria arbuscula]|uniref:Uncharacterized protein n=1 Tax=Xylaria arbuscula TaxID=114810 RepID=A0A9W8TLR0_9PEZI|nr:hypothetical protein NPX13_g4649 [Xylaria arbuscula]